MAEEIKVKDDCPLSVLTNHKFKRGLRQNADLLNKSWSLRAAVRKYRLGACKMKKSKIPKLCQNIALGKLFLEK